MSQRERADECVVGAFRAFQRSWFRRLWVGRSLATAGLRMQAVARDWLAYSLSGSSLATSIVVSSWSLGTFLLSLVGGATADRVDKRKLLVFAQAACGVVILAVAGLVFTDIVRVWHLVVTAFCLAGLFAFIIPARTAVMSELCHSGLLMNAMALSSAGLGMMGIVGSTLGGILSEEFSPAVTFAVTTVLFATAASFYSLLPTVALGADAETPIGRIVTEGGQYILAHPGLMALFGLELVRALFFQYTILLPAVAGEVYQMGGLALGLLTGARGVGSLVGSLLMAWRGDTHRAHALLLVSGVLGGLGLVVFGQLRSFVAAFVALSLVAIAEYVYMITRSTLLQSVQSERMRGRMVGFRRLILGLAPLGGLPAGALADAVGPLRTATYQGLIVTVLFGGVALWRARQRGRSRG